MSKQVVSRLDAGRNGESDLSIISNHSVDTPALVRCVQTILVDLEPLQAGNVKVGRIVNFGTERRTVRV